MVFPVVFLTLFRAVGYLTTSCANLQIRVAWTSAKCANFSRYRLYRYLWVLIWNICVMVRVWRDGQMAMLTITWKLFAEPNLLRYVYSIKRRPISELRHLLSLLRSSGFIWGVWMPWSACNVRLRCRSNRNSRFFNPLDENIGSTHHPVQIVARFPPCLWSIPWVNFFYIFPPKATQLSLETWDRHHGRVYGSLHLRLTDQAILLFLRQWYHLSRIPLTPRCSRRPRESERLID